MPITSFVAFNCVFTVIVFAVNVSVPIEDALVIFPLYICVTFSVPVLSVTTLIIFAVAAFTFDVLVDISPPRMLLVNTWLVEVILLETVEPYSVDKYKLDTIIVDPFNVEKNSFVTIMVEPTNVEKYMVDTFETCVIELTVEIVEPISVE